MAYGIYIASVCRKAIAACAANKRHPLNPSALGYCTHLLAQHVCQDHPQLMATALDGGEDISSDFNHRFRNPKFHDADRVKALFELLDELSLEIAETLGHGWYCEFERALRVFEHASHRGECVVTA